MFISWLKSCLVYTLRSHLSMLDLVFDGWMFSSCLGNEEMRIRLNVQRLGG